MDWYTLSSFQRIGVILLVIAGIIAFFGISWLIAQIGTAVYIDRESRKLDGEEVKHFDKFV
jgi:hypothetical protein